MSQSLSSKLTCEREMAQKALELLLTAQNAFERERERDQLTRLLNSCSQLTARSRERSAHKALDLLLTAHSAFERERDQLTRLLNSCSQLRARSRERSAHKGAISYCCIWESFAGISCDYKRKAGWPQILIKQC